MPRLLFSISISLNHPPRGNSSATPSHDSNRNATKRSLILGLDDGSLRCAPSVHPSTLRSPVSSLRAPNHSARIPTSNAAKGVWRLSATAGLDEAGIIPLAATLHCCSVHAAWKSRARAIASAHEPTQSEKGHPGALFCCRRSTAQKNLGLCFWFHRLFFFE